MKFQFKIQPFQTEAAEAVARVFNGQPKQEGVTYRRDLGRMIDPGTGQYEIQFDDDTGYRNAAVELSDEQILKNIRELQAENNIKLSPSLVKGLGAVSLDIEMETGTGKTYVYIKTMFELHKRFGVRASQTLRME